MFFLLLLGQSVPAQVVHTFKGDRYTHYRPDDWISYLNALDITSVDIGEDHIYFGSLNGGILRYEKYRNHWDDPMTTSNGLSSNRIYDLVYNPEDGKLYARTDRGIDEYWFSDRWWRPSSRANLPPGRQPKPEELKGVVKGKDYYFPPYFRPSNSFLPDFFTDVSLMYTPDGTIYDQQNRQFSLTDRIADDRQRLWIGTNGMGPLLGELFSRRLESMPQSIPNIAPRDMYLTEDELWTGGIRTRGQIGGITRWDRQADKWEYFEAPFISSMYKDNVLAVSGGDGFVGFATSYGVLLYDLNKDKWQTFTVMDGLEGDLVFDVLVKDSTLYCASEYGINWIDLRSMRVYEPRETILDHVPVYQLAVENELIWAATRFGLYRIDLYDGSITFIASRAGVVDYDLRAVEIVNNEIWCAGTGGISFWNRETDAWYSFPNLDFKGTYRDILATKNSIWFATDRGLLKYDRKQEYWRLFTEKDGLVNDDVYHLELDPVSNRLWLSTETGLSSFRWKRRGRID